jgi:hypothetical protein
MNVLTPKYEACFRTFLLYIDCIERGAKVLNYYCM